MAGTVDANAAVDSYLKGMASAGAKYSAGIQKTTVNPMQKAADQEAYYLQRVTEASTSGRRKAALLAADPNVWKQNAITVGATRLASGAQKAKPKVVAHFNKWAPIYSQISQAVNALPKGGLANAQARANMAIQMAMQAAGRA